MPGTPGRSPAGRSAAGGQDRAERLLERPSSVLLLALFSGLLYWAALPPLGWWPCGWLAPLGWLVLIEHRQLAGRRPHFVMWFAAALAWALIMQGIRLAHWANYLGLVAVAAYLGIYLPLFIAVARVVRHRWRVPLAIAAPVAWVGAEVVRGYGPLGFSMALLAHTQVKLPRVIQFADVAGPYGVSFVIVLLAAAGYQTVGAVTRRDWKATGFSAASVVVVLSGVLSYGKYRLGEPLPANSATPLRVALIQGSIDTAFGDGRATPERTLSEYSELTVEAVNRYPSLDLVVWPETMFPVRDVLVTADPPRLPQPLDERRLADTQQAFKQLVRNGIRRINRSANNEQSESSGAGTSWIFGASTWQFGTHPPRRYNAAILVAPGGEIRGRYFKRHPVIFGEYVPFGEAFPALYRLFPLPNGLTPGTEAVAWEVDGLNFSPSICFENTMPHLIRRQVAELRRAGQPVDVLINLTNDGWFWGSSILDMQLNCAVFRAIEQRKPFLVAANTGFSAWIDGNGKVRAKGPRRDTATLLAQVVPDGRESWYAWWGDIPAWACATASLLLCLLSGASKLATATRGRVASAPS